MSKKLIITLNDEITDKYLSLARPKTQAEVDEGCLPSGVSIRIDITPPFGDTAFFRDGSKWVELGEVTVELKENE